MIMRKLVAKYSVSAIPVLFAAKMALAQSAYFQAVTNLNPVAYWPLQETTQPPVANVETNIGILGPDANAYYESANSQQGAPGAIASESDTAVSMGYGANN